MKLSEEKSDIANIKDCLINETVTGTSLNIQDSSNCKVQDIKIYGGEEAVTGDVDVTVCNENFINPALIERGSADEDGWITVEHTNTSNTYHWLLIFSKEGEVNNIKTNTTYTFVLEIKEISEEKTESTQYNSALILYSSETNAQTYFSGNVTAQFSNFTEGGTYIYTKTSKSSFEDCIKALRTMIRVADNCTIKIVFRLSLFEGTDITEDNFKYISRKEQSYTLNLGDIALSEGEYIHKSDGKWYIYSNEDTEITDITLISQLNNLANCNTYKTVTNVYSETDNLEPTIELTYIADTKTYIANAIASAE